MREVAAANDARIYAISPDTNEQSREFIKKIEADGKPVTFSLLSDPESTTVDRYGLRDPAYAGQKFAGVPYPAVFVLDRDRKIRWSKVETDYRQRASVEEIRAALESIR